MRLEKVSKEPALGKTAVCYSTPLSSGPCGCKKYDYHGPPKRYNFLGAIYTKRPWTQPTTNGRCIS
jgi:hypothetical protein